MTKIDNIISSFLIFLCSVVAAWSWSLQQWSVPFTAEQRGIKKPDVFTHSDTVCCWSVSTGTNKSLNCTSVSALQLSSRGKLWEFTLKQTNVFRFTRPQKALFVLIILYYFLSCMKVKLNFHPRSQHWTFVLFNKSESTAHIFLFVSGTLLRWNQLLSPRKNYSHGHKFT